MRTLLLLATFPFPIATASPQGIRQLPTQTTAIVDEAIARQMQQQKAVGVAIGIVQGGKVVYTSGYGFEDREKQIPVTSKTMFRWASISKTLAAYAAMQLVEQDKLDLDADIRELVPEFPDKGVKITARDLLCHQSGIVHYSNGKVIRTKKRYKLKHPFVNVANALDTFKDSPLIARPGEKYSYSTHAFILLSAVVERAGRQKFATQVEQRIVRPLKLTKLQPDYQWKKIPNRAVGYRLRNGKVTRSTNTDVSWKLAGGGYISNVDDLATYAAAIINGNLISKETQAVMWEPQKTNSGQTTAVGLGIFVDGTGPALRVSHNGSQEKAKTRMVTYPNRKSGVVVMSNSENVNPGQFSTAIYRALSMAKP
jgi:CubicO group peptidase (beta-lactamase class C family)